MPNKVQVFTIVEDEAAFALVVFAAVPSIGCEPLLPLFMQKINNFYTAESEATTGKWGTTRVSAVELIEGHIGAPSRNPK